MTFGPFAEDDCWVIEKSATYASLGEGVKIVEFGWLRTPAMIFLVEAKSSAPNPDSPLANAQEKLAEFMDDIRDKMSNALALTIAACLRRHPIANSELPANWNRINLGEVGFRFVLVIRGHRAEWLDPLRYKLNQSLRTVSRLWALPGDPAVVINEELARKHGLIA